tara:strand:- start:6 stop:2483 length:2478 start_codon:yes stop_codon:yes gene_type:complete
MTKRMLIDATQSEETRVVLSSGSRVEDFDFEVSKRRPLKGNIYLAQVTRVEPSLQAAFIEYGGNRHGFLAFNEIHPDYYRIPMEDREALLAEHAESIESSLPLDTGNPDHEGHPASPEEHPNSDEGKILTENNPPENLSENNEELINDKDSSTQQLDEKIDEHASEQKKNSERKRKSPKRYKIQEVIARRQIMLIQVVKEERGNKGAALTTYLSLAGRYCVLMPNTPKGGGVSRKIINPADRKRLKNVVEGLNSPDGMAVIVRTAGSERTKTEIKRDYEYLIRLWDQIRESTLVSTAPYLVHEEANLIKRCIRDLYTRDIDEILIEGEEGYKLAKSFMKTLMPSHAKRVQRFSGGVPIFNKFKIETQLDYLYEPTVQLKSGGYIVLNQTEALVAVDVNSGRSTKERNIEETALKTNLEAADEIARQLKLRDLAGLVVIDFIDMYENKNQHAIERKMRDVVKSDRARIQMSRISQFGLMELSRQRLRPSVMEASTQPCPHCTGTGVVRSIESTALQVLRNLEEEGIKQQAAEVTVFVPTEIGFYLLNRKRDALIEMEERYDFRILLDHDDKLIVPEHRIEKTENKTKDRQLKELVELAEENKSEGENPNQGKDLSSSDKRSNTKNRTRRRRTNQTNKSIPANTNNTQNTDEKQLVHAEDDQRLDDNDPSKKKKRRGKRGGRRRIKRDTNADFTDINEIEGNNLAEGVKKPAPDEIVVSSSENNTYSKSSQISNTDVDAVKDKDKPPRKKRTRGSAATSKRKSSKTSELKSSIDEQNVEIATETAKVKPKSSKVVRIKKQNDATEEETQKGANKAKPRQGWWNRDTD